jgi:tetratricopeptide (TPR) repeat protein
MTNKHTRAWFIALGLAVASLTATVTAPVWADDVADVAKLIQSGQYPEALQKADAYLIQHPKDAQMRFSKGLILAEQNKTNEAIVVFTKLTEDFPDLPEPYNNLAVLFASTNQFDKARAALEMAIRTNPSYGTAHENLGDVYAKMASQAYDKALQLDSGNSGAKLKLTLIRNLFTNSNSILANNTAVNPAANSAAKTAAKPAVAVAKPASAPVTKTPEPAKQVATVVAPPATKPVVAPAKPDIKPVSTPEAKVEPKTANNNVDQSEVLKVVDAWAAAWSNKNTSSYLTFYGKDFQLPKGTTRKSWAEERRLRIEGKGRISVKVDSPKVLFDGNTATVKFRQIYNSDQLKADSRKTLVFTKQDGKWQITQERTGG